MKTGILLINLGTPSKPDKWAVGLFLKAFLSDKRVVDLPFWIRYVLLYAFILPFRTAKSAKAYELIWDPVKGSPLLYNTNAMGEALQTYLGNRFNVQIAMRYGEPSIAKALALLLKDGIDELIILPLFPQYSSAATGSAIEATLKALKNWKFFPKIRIISQFFDHPSYIEAKAFLINNQCDLSKFDAIMFSFHSLPLRQLKEGYETQCYATADLLASKLGLNKEMVQVAFQSQLRKSDWLGPSIEDVMQDFRKKKKDNILVICPSFVADCLETLEEIAIRGKNNWLQLGGRNYQLIPALNASKEWIKAIEQLIKSL